MFCPHTSSISVYNDSLGQSQASLHRQQVFRRLISSETVNIALLQTAAKVQELLIVASLATELLRYEFIHGDGLPLGLLAASFDFAKLS